jgi:hypothetical protein
VVEAQVSKADYIEKLKRFHAQHGRAPTAGECGAGHSPKRNQSVPSYNTLCWHFGTYRKALEAAGVPYRLHGVRLNTTARNTHNIRAGLPVDSATNRIDCPVDRMHRPRMIPDTTQYGFPMGRLIAWCYECKCEIPNTSLPAVLTAAEREAFQVEEHHSQRPRTAPRMPHERKAKPAKRVFCVTDNRRRDAEIRLAWARGVTLPTLAMRYELPLDRVEKIVLGRRRSA